MMKSNLPRSQNSHTLLPFIIAAERMGTCIKHFYLHREYHIDFFLVCCCCCWTYYLFCKCMCAKRNFRCILMSEISIVWYPSVVCTFYGCQRMAPCNYTRCCNPWLMKIWDSIQSLCVIYLSILYGDKWAKSERKAHMEKIKAHSQVKAVACCSVGPCIQTLHSF